MATILVALDGSDIAREAATVYPARMITGRSTPNRTLNLIVAASVLLQLLTVASPGLRTVLGLEQLDAGVYALIAVALVISILGVFASARLSRRSVRRSPADPSPAAAR
jgi:membrane protein implicated in regulation of membrane protease activity